ncbi:Homoserine kinase [hydrothermal vent metagenome]|uniref:Homoserine kinase n=1 Tax=hydrothermal vent metagenome TaxID=652676 RepID=A0A1W1BZ32_9ZZZZ
MQEANELFPAYEFVEIIPTKYGIIDTTYIVKSSACEYILKRYERATEKEIETNNALLALLFASNLNTPKLLDKNKEWYLYTKLKGEIPKNIELMHIKKVANFMAEFHNISKNFKVAAPFISKHKINTLLATLKKSHYFYYKKLSCLHTLVQKEDGFIHGDLFRDNTLFAGGKIAVFDFIDGGLGAFSFDIAVALLSFNPKNRALYHTIFLQTYNQKAKKKITKKTLQQQLHAASKFYALLRIVHDKKTERAKELANFW